MDGYELLDSSKFGPGYTEKSLLGGTKGKLLGIGKSPGSYPAPGLGIPQGEALSGTGLT